MSWFLADEYEALINAETSSNPDPAAIKAAAAEAVRVATLAAAQMPKFRSEFELSAYMESIALRNSVEDGLRVSIPFLLFLVLELTPGSASAWPWCRCTRTRRRSTRSSPARPPC